METRRTNTFLRVALGARSPARPKYFKSKFYDNQQDTRLHFPAGFADGVVTGLKTADGGNRMNYGSLPDAQSRAKTTKEGKLIELINLVV